MNAQLVNEIHTALKQYHRVSDLAHHEANQWPAVVELHKQGIDIVSSIRRVLDQALVALETTGKPGVDLLRQQYLSRRSVEYLMHMYAFDRSTLHRQRNKLLQELSLLIIAFNHQAEQRNQVARFYPRQPVLGFEDLVSELTAYLHDDDSPSVLIIEGIGGIGKTTLARQIAYACANDDVFRDVLWVSAKQVDFDIWGGMQRSIPSASISPDDILRDLARELHMQVPLDIADLRMQIQAQCIQHAYLIILDNLDSVADVVALSSLIDMLAGRSRVLITTRERAIEALPSNLPRRYVLLKELEAEISYQILRHAAVITGAPDLASASDEELSSIYAITGGNPLALWLVAGQAYGIPWKVFLQELIEQRPQNSKGYELYDYLYRRSWEQLSENARLVLFSMHRCNDGASYELLFELSMLERDEFQRALDELQRRMLLVFDRWYVIHQLTYSFLRIVIAGWWA